MALSQLLQLFGCMKIQTLHAPYHFNSGLGSGSYWERGFAHVSDGTLFFVISCVGIETEVRPIHKARSQAPYSAK